MSADSVASSVLSGSRSTPRHVDIDAVRVVGIVAVVAGHVWAVGPFADALYAWHVPVFFVLTGYLWKSGRGVGEEVTRRARSLLVPYLIWLVIIGGVFLVVLPLVHGDPISTGSIRNALWGGYSLTRPFSAFWFVTVLFFTAVLYRILDSYCPAWVPWIVAIGGLAAAHVLGLGLARTPLGIGLAVPALAFVLLGRRLRTWLTLVRRGRLWAGIGAVLLGEALVLSHASEPVNMKWADFGTPVLGVVVAVVISAGLLLVASEAFGCVSGPSATIITALAGCGFMVVLTHAVVLQVLGTPDSGRAGDFLLALVGVWAAALLAARTPVRRLVIGGS